MDADDILAGPIVRRVEPLQVSIWMALTKPHRVKVALWRGMQTAGTAELTVASNEFPLATGEVTARRYGKRFFVALVVVDIPAPGLAPGATFAYDVQVDGKGLRARGFLDDEQLTDALRAFRSPALALGYESGKLPTFVTPGDTLERTRLAQASCRNTVGPRFDALAWLDDEIEKTRTTPEKRPQLLFMTGDQIYADDLSAQLLHMLSSIGREVIGSDELLRAKTTFSPAPDADDVTIDDRLTADLRNFPARRRQPIVIRLGGYTTGDGANHLLSYGEYIAMYLAVWNPRIWRTLVSRTEVDVALACPLALRPFQGAIPLADDATLDAAQRTSLTRESQAGFDLQGQRLTLFRQGVPHVARALANVATYMIFDDHDVTDDWNLSKKWVNRCYTKPFGRQIVRNAVMAYAVCQAQGNDPRAFTTGANKAMLDEIEKLYGADTGPFPIGIASSEIAEPVDTLCGSSSAAASVQPVWNYTVLTPRTKIIVLDTRTRRKFTGQGYVTPDLIGLNRDQQIPAGPLSDGRELLILVSATPVFGPDVIDNVGWPVAQIAVDAEHKGRGLDGNGVQRVNVGSEHYDAEGWSQNELAREALFKRLMTYPSVVILAGDVHYATSATIDYYKKGAKVATARFIQLTSSPARNQFKQVVRLIVRQTPAVQAVVKQFAVARMGWDTKSSIVVPANQVLSPGRRSRLVRSPSMVPASGWPAGTSIPADKPPDWSWRLALVRDVRPESAVPPALRQVVLPASGELVEANALDAYRDVARVHQQMTIARNDFVRQIVFVCNIGLVDFAKDASGKARVRHVLLSQDAPDGLRPVEGTVHEIALAPAADPPPSLEFR